MLGNPAQQSPLDTDPAVFILSKWLSAASATTCKTATKPGIKIDGAKFKPFRWIYLGGIKH